VDYFSLPLDYISTFQLFFISTFLFSFYYVEMKELAWKNCEKRTPFPWSLMWKWRTEFFHIIIIFPMSFPNYAAEDKEVETRRDDGPFLSVPCSTSPAA